MAALALHLVTSAPVERESNSNEITVTSYLPWRIPLNCIPVNLHPSLQSIHLMGPVIPYAMTIITVPQKKMFARKISQ